MKLKKLTLWILAMALLVSMCGCGTAQEETEPSSAPTSPAATVESEPTPEPTPTQEPTPTPEPTPEPTPTPVPQLAPAYHGTEAVQERGVLTIGVSGNSRTCYIIPDDPEKYGELVGTRDGYVPAFCRRIAEELGVEAEFVEYKSIGEQLQAVADGEVDLVADNFTITDERLALYEMTDNFCVSDIDADEVFLSTSPQPWLPSEEEPEADSNSDADPDEETPAEPVPREMIQSEEELAHARIAVVSGSIQVKNVMSQYPEAELYLMDTNEKILEALAAGEVDACVFTMIDNTFADQITQEILNGRVAQCDYRVATPDFRGFGLILMKGNEDLCQSINEMLADFIESGWMLECYENESAKANERGI